MAGGSLPKQEKTLVVTCPAGIWFDDRCRGLRFWRSIKPNGSAFAAVFGNSAKAPGEIGSAVLITIENDAIVNEDHLVGEERVVPATRDGGLVGALNEGALPAGAAQHLFDYELLSRVKVTKGETDGFNMIYYEVAVPKKNGDLTLYYSVLRKYGPSGSYGQVECTTDQYRAEKGLGGPAGCLSSSAQPQNGTSRPGCTPAMEIAAFAIGGAAAHECGGGVGMIASGGAFRPSQMVLAGVATSPNGEAVRGGLTFAAILGRGEVAKGLYCPAVGKVQEDLSGHATGCMTSDLPISPEELLDVYETDSAEVLNIMIAETGLCAECNEYGTEWVGRVWEEKEQQWVDIHERVCTDWTWGRAGVDENADLFCD